MSDATRRTFLAAAGTSAAAAAAVAAAPRASAAPSATAVTESSAPAGQRLVAYVDDPRSGRVVLMHGEDEVTIQDADLVRRLTRAARR
ncbi:hypothetical protein ABEG17_06065 [Pedococcus sp. KACC 23699]|uniref:Twin-arginine translocation signal domain-containing protein n=1 Tax=Pedococcus sp. KACC 23699 TaxID=3149228 RepID=A0AAU7JXJ8_9MICO